MYAGVESTELCNNLTEFETETLQQVFFLLSDFFQALTEFYIKIIVHAEDSNKTIITTFLIATL